MIDVSAEIEIAASPATIAGVMFDPARNHEWMKGVEKVEILDPALAPGARVRYSGDVMGKKLSLTTTVEAVHFPHVLELRISDGPFVGTSKVGIQRSAGGSRVQVRTTGELEGMSFIPDSMIAGPVKSAIQNGLGRLKALIETT